MVVLTENQNLMILSAVFFGHLCLVRCSRNNYESYVTSTASSSSSFPLNDHPIIGYDGTKEISPSNVAVDSSSGVPGREGRRPEENDSRNPERSHRQHHLRRSHRHLHRQDNMIELPKLEFSESEYRAKVREDIPIQTSILQVRLASPSVLVASDVVFRVNDEDHFGIDRSGVLYNKRPLDYEGTNGHYLLRIIAEYKGDLRENPFGERITSETAARISIVDTPEPPRFETDQYFFSIPELASTGAYVGAVKAFDDDDDLEAYVLQDVRPPGMFTIDRETGIIRIGRMLTSIQDRTYDFQVGAVDFAGHVTITPVTVYRIARLVQKPEEENFHKPIFLECDAYDGIRVKENMTEGTPVLMVLATDEDRGNSGIVSYALLNDFGRFTIQASNQHGQISTTKRLDRDGEDKEFYLTVVARDGGSGAHQGSCSFKVIVEDINDNPPLFDQQIYEETISTDHIASTPALRVSASDRDSGHNAEISFSLQGNPDDMKYFTINSDTGIITLTKSLEESMANRRLFEMRARASDRGTPVLWSSADVRIQVVSSDDLPPTIVSQQPLYPEVWENTTENTDVLTLCARSNLADSSLVYFTLLNGNTPDTNSDGTFAIRRQDNSDVCHDSTGVTVFVATRNLDFETIQEYTLTIQLINDHNARAEKKIQVSILDVNDNAPLLQPFDGAVLENIDSMLITTIKAHDKDVSPQFRQLRYSFDVMASGDVRQKFALKSNGELWTTEPLDREAFKQYKIPIKVTDGVPAHERMTIYWITVQDLNDVPPTFDYLNGIYEVELPENREVGKSTGVKLSINDSDIVNLFEYQIVEGNSEQKFRIDEATGEILVNKVLDYDHPVNDRNFTLRVRVFDGANPPAETNVVIAVTNVNDLQPVFEQSNYTFNVIENTDCNITFGKVSAIDPDLPRTVNQNILYYLSPVEQLNFTIDSRNGDLSLKGCLDREAATKGIMTLYPRANDEGGRGHDADPATVHLVIRDLNDNHPHIHLPENSYARIMENMDPEDVKSIIIKLNDVDGGENGCPCTMEFDPETPTSWLENFSLLPVEGLRSTYRLNPLVSLDREEQKVYPLPFVTQDRRGRRGIRLFILEVGDENDSPMSNGTSRIKVYNYQGQFPSMVIGAVYVTDLDDYDLVDKVFEVDATTSSDVANHFQVDVNSGNITMLKGTPAGCHLLRVKVYDEFRRETAVGVVNITVVDLNFSAVMKSGSLTIADIKAQQMLGTGKVANTVTVYERLKEQIARIHKIPRDNVDIFSMRDVNGGVQIRYNCHSSPYYTAAKLDGLLMKNRREVSNALGLDIVMVDINACLYESKSPCGGKSCQHTMRPNLTSPLVVASSTATMVGVDITDEYTCDCGELEPLPSVCFSDFCYNGGTCSIIDNALKCQCIDDHNYGPRCELKNARFEKSFAWYEPLKVCDNSTFTITFRSNKHSGILLYMGPIVESPWEEYPKDFLYVFLRNWVLVTYVDLGSGTEKVSIPIEKNTNRFFQFVVIWNKKKISFEVIDCGFNSTIGSGDPCKVSIPYPHISMYPNFLLNVQGPLQVGGLAPMPNFASLSASYRWNLIPPVVGYFSGCILEMRQNDFLYDFNASDYGSGPVQPCDAPRTSRVVLGQQSIIIILASLFCLLVLVLLILCLARRGRKTVSYPDLDRELVKETMGGTDLEAFGEKDVTHFDLKFLQVTPDGYVVKDGEESNLPDVTQDARQCRSAPLAKMPEGLSIGDFINSNIKKVDQEQQDGVDDVRHYNISGDEMSVAASLSSLASGFHSTTGSSKSEFSFDYKNDWCHRFDKIVQIYGKEPGQKEDHEYNFQDLPDEKGTTLAGTATINRRKPSVTNDKANCYTLPASLKRKNAASSPSPVLAKNIAKPLTSRNSGDCGVPALKDSPKSITEKDSSKGRIKSQSPPMEGRNLTSASSKSKSVETWC
ncbi:neural-cadherin-like isoform X2 [Macrobrachium nipponense]|uniref:neural-cadherin-like isoform X2 n=1 Tax=Macrobrachium nipponense TaxID=159736 RepID=UPI0030C7A732